MTPFAPLKRYLWGGGALSISLYSLAGRPCIPRDLYAFELVTFFPRRYGTSVSTEVDLLLLTQPKYS